MKLPGSDLHLHLEHLPNLDLMVALERGIWIKTDKKGNFFIQVAKVETNLGFSEPVKEGKR